MMLQACVRCLIRPCKCNEITASVSARFIPNDPISPRVSYGKRAITVAAKDRIEHVKGKYVGREADKKRVSPWTNARTFRKSKMNARFSPSPPLDFLVRSNSYVSTQIFRELEIENKSHAINSHFYQSRSTG